jgi:acyl carrier protein
LNKAAVRAEDCFCEAGFSVLRCLFLVNKAGNRLGGWTLEALKTELRQLLTELVHLPEGFDEKADLYGELGMASIQAMELLLELEERFGIRVPDEEFIEATSLDSLARMILGLKG